MSKIDDRDYRHVLDTFFAQPNILVDHQIESFNTFITQDISRIVSQFSPFEFIVERPDSGIDIEAKNVKMFKVSINFKEVTLHKPKIEETSGNTFDLFPNDARLKGLTYQSPIFIKIDFSVTSMDAKQNIISTFAIDISKPEKMGYIPVMLRSRLCNLNGLNKHILQAVGEDPYDYGGYFVVKGSEKFIVPQEKRNENYAFLFQNKKDADFTVVVEIKSVRDDTVSRGSNIKVKYERRRENIWVSINPGFGGKDIPLSVLFRALGIQADKEIAEYVVSNLNDLILLELLRPSLMFEIKDQKTSATYKIRTQTQALLYIAERIVGHQQKLDTDIEKQRYVLGLIDKYLFPHVPDQTGAVKKRKAMFLAMMVRKLLNGKLGRHYPDDRDDLGNKRIDLAGTLVAQLFRFAMSSLLENMKKNITKELVSKTFRSKEDFQELITRTKNTKLLAGPFNSSLLTGNWKTSSNRMTTQRVGVAQLLQRKSTMDTFSNLRRIFTPTTGGDTQLKTAEIRRLHPSHWGMICPVETPDGKSAGVVKHLAITCTVTTFMSPEPVYRILQELSISDQKLIIPLDELPPTEVYKLTTIYVNGNWYGSTDNPKYIYDELIKRRRNLQMNPKVSIVRYFENDELWIYTDAGRCVRPIYIVDPPKNTLRINKKILSQLSGFDPIGKMTWNDLISNQIVEYVDVKESENNTVIAEYPSQIYKTNADYKTYTHCELHPICMLGGLVGLIPFSEHNQAPRNLFQGAMGKQAVNVYALNFQLRMDTQANVLHYPQKPLVTTYMVEPTNFDKQPAGTNAMVAIMMYTGYNQEDSIIVNQSSLERGLFVSTSYKSFKEKAKNEEKFIKPDPNKTKGIKTHANYNKLNKYGIVPKDIKIDPGDVVIGKVSALDRTERDGQIDQRDTSLIMTKETTGIVDNVVMAIDEDGYEQYSIKIRKERIPQIGDKLCETADTEVLTMRGWVPYPKLTLQDFVATLTKDNKIYYENPKQIYEYDHNGPLLKVETDRVDFQVTMYHKMYVKNIATTYIPHHYELIPAIDIIDQTVVYKNSACNFAPPIDELSFNDGKIIKGQMKINQFLEAAAIYLILGTETLIFRARLYTFNLYEYELYFQEFIDNFSKIQFCEYQSRIFINHILDSEGQYRTHNKKLIDDIQQFVFHCSWESHIYYTEESGINTIQVYKNVQQLPLVYPSSNLNMHYQGKVYCLEVSSHVFFRRRNGKASFGGNSARHGQKGVIGIVYRQEDMPFNNQGITPDLIINPQAIPSRMTVGQLMELVTAKASAINGTIADATPFTGISVESIIDELKAVNFEEYGTDTMYDGFTGKPIQMKIFFGPTFYQRLKHIVAEKMHARSTGQVQMLTRQPLEGRARDGGLRFGEMERDAMIGHGTVNFLKERFYESSDKYEVFLCDNCGHMAIGNPVESIYKCQSCSKSSTLGFPLSSSSISKVQIPYAAKLLVHEIISMGVSVRMFTEGYSGD